MNSFLLAVGDMGFAGLVTVTGLVVVFSVLVLLILIFKIFGLIMSGISNKKKKKTKEALKKKSEAVTPKNIQTASTASSPTPQVEGGISNEIVAVISAAVAVFGGGRIKSVKKSVKKNTGRSAWANAGIVDNTKPF